MLRACLAPILEPLFWAPGTWEGAAQIAQDRAPFAMLGACVAPIMEPLSWALGTCSSNRPESRPICNDGGLYGAHFGAPVLGPRHVQLKSPRIAPHLPCWGPVWRPFWSPCLGPPARAAQIAQNRAPFVLLGACLAPILEPLSWAPGTCSSNRPESRPIRNAGGLFGAHFGAPVLGPRHV